MNKQRNAVTIEKSRFDSLKWILIVLLLAAGVYADYHFVNVAWAVRAAVGIVLVVVMLLIASKTGKGRRAWQFMKNARSEMRRVVWPTRQEAGQTTLMVVVIVVIMALVLWGVDSLFIWIIGLLTGQGG